MNNQLISAGDLIENSWAIYRRNWKPLLKVSLWMFLPTVLVTLTTLILRLSGARNALSFVLTFLVSIPAYLAQFIISIVFALMINAVLEKRKIEVRQSAEEALKNFFPILIVVILNTLAVLGGFLLLVIPGIILTVWFAFAYYEAALSGMRGVEALKKSRELVRGRWWPILWRLSATTIFWSAVIWLLVSALFLVFEAITAPWKELISSEPGASYAAAALDAVTNAAQAAAAPLFTAVGVLLYKALKEISAPKTETVLNA